MFVLQNCLMSRNDMKLMNAVLCNIFPQCPVAMTQVATIVLFFKVAHEEKLADLLRLSISVLVIDNQRTSQPHFVGLSASMQSSFFFV